MDKPEIYSLTYLILLCLTQLAVLNSSELLCSWNYYNLKILLCRLAHHFAREGIFSGLLINILKTMSSSTDSHGYLLMTSLRKDHLLLSSISWSTMEDLFFFTASNKLQPPKTRVSPYQQQPVRGKWSAEYCHPVCIAFQQTYAELCGLHPPRGSIFSEN